VPDHEAAPSVETVFAALRQRLPSVTIERLQVKYPADDNNLWFIRADASPEVQVGTYPDGLSPFLIEGDSPGQRRETSDVGEALDLILAWLSPS